MKEKNKQSIFNYLSSYISEHPEQLVRDDDHCEDCMNCGFDRVSRCSHPIGAELWNCDIKDVIAGDQYTNDFKVDFLIEAEIEVYRSERDYYVGGEWITQCYKLEAYLDFDESVIKYKSLSICEDW